MASNFAGSFAAGLVNGFVKGKQMQQAQEKHDLEVKRLKDDADMHDMLKMASEDLKPKSQYIVTAADGSTMAADTESAAAKIAKGMDGAQVSQAYMVGNQRFDTQDAADQAAFMANDPVSKAQRVAAIYNQFGHPDQAMSVMNGANALQDLRAKESFSSINRQIESGDFAGLSKTYGQMVGDPSIMVSQGRDGSVIVTRAGENGAPTLMHSYKTTDDFKAASAGALARSPTEALNQYWVKKNFDATQEYRQQSLANQGAELGLSAQRLGLQKTESDARIKAAKDKALMDKNPVSYIQGLGADNNLATIPVYRTFDTATGQWSERLGTPLATGLKPNRQPLSPTEQIVADALARSQAGGTGKSAADIAAGTKGYETLGPRVAPPATPAAPGAAPVTPPGQAPTDSSKPWYSGLGLDLSRPGHALTW